MIGTAYWYLHTDQWRYDTLRRRRAGLPDRRRAVRRQAHRRPARPVGAAGLDADACPRSTATRWTWPTRRWPPDPDDPAALCGRTRCATGRLGFACEDPDAPQNWPRVLTVWRANLLGSSRQGQRVLPAPPARHRRVAAGGRGRRRSSGPQDVRWRDEAPEGKLDLLLSLDFRMTSTTLFSDVVLPAATWYEKHDLSSTDMHPFVHAFNPAIAPPWQTRTDFDAFHGIARAFSALAGRAPGRPPGPGGRAAAARHPGRAGHARAGWSATGPAAGDRCRARPCRSSSWWSATTARSRRRWPRSGRCWTGWAPPPRAVTVDVAPEIAYLRQVNGDGPRRGRRRPAAR